jgi:serine/threonine-protein kinase
MVPSRLKRPEVLLLVVMVATMIVVGVVTIAGAGAARGTTPRVTVPSVVGLRSPAAKRRLGAVGLHVSIRTVVSSRPVGSVVGQRPLAGVGTAPGSVVTLSVSGGAAPARPSGQVSVPDLMGQLTDAAQQHVSDLGLAPFVVYVESLKLVGTVIAQAPAAGTRVAPGTRVTITISRGPGP